MQNNNAGLRHLLLQVIWSERTRNMAAEVGAFSLFLAGLATLAMVLQ